MRDAMFETNRRQLPPERRPLTPRQREILGLVASGLSTAEIAARLGITPGTVKAHLTMIYSRIGVKNRVQATRYYLDGLAPGAAERRG